MRRPGSSARTKAPRGARSAPVRSTAVNTSFRGGATPAVRDYLGDLGAAEIRASRGSTAPDRRERAGRRAPSPAPRSRRDSAKPVAREPAARKPMARESAARKPAPASVRSQRDRSADTRRQSLRALDQNLTRNRSSRAARSVSGPGPSGGRMVAAAGGAAALTVGRAVVDVARPAAAAAKPMLRVVTGGLEKLPAGPGAQAAARGRILIVIAGLLAAGLIYINVGKLEAGDGYARYAQRSLELQRENTIIQSKVAALESSERIGRRAKKLGMVMPQPEQFKYLRSRANDPLRAIRNYTTPTPVVQQTQPPAPQNTTPTTTAPDTGAAAPQQTTPPAVTPQTQQPATTPGAVAPTAGTTPGANTGAPAAGR